MEYLVGNGIDLSGTRIEEIEVSSNESSNETHWKAENGPNDEHEDL